jgi:hypothetical protein
MRAARYKCRIENKNKKAAYLGRGDRKCTLLAFYVVILLSHPMPD